MTSPGFREAQHRVRHRMVMRVVTAGVVLSTLSVTALAQQATTPPQATQTGPMVLEQVHNGFAAAPDVKVTDVNGRTGWLAGGYGGWLIDNTLLIGGGGYWLANGSRTRKMAYAGGVVEWLQFADRPIGFSLRGLVGLGEATLSTHLSSASHFPFARFGRHHEGGFDPADPIDVQVLIDSGFFVAEPQANLLVRFAPWLRLEAGVGYRLIGRAGGMEDQLRGATGSLALQFGGSASRRRSVQPSSGS